MQILIHSIKMPIRHTKEDVLKAAQEIVRLNFVFAEDFWIYKRSIDARRKNDIHYVYSVAAKAPDTTVCDGKVITELKNGENIEIPQNVNLVDRPVVVGTGPCGLFAAYVLAKSGNPPLVVERGDRVEERVKAINSFWNGEGLNPNSNVQFGEGGAGTFSDGKLNTGTNDIRQRYVLKTFTEFGAPEDIMYKAKPHIGTDKLRKVVSAMRDEIIRLGGEVRFNTCLTGIKKENGRITGVEFNGNEEIKCCDLVLAIGHSSRDTYAMLNSEGVYMEAKPFAMGVRIEHNQSFIDRIQYGRDDLELPPADYKLVYNGKDRSCYSFCMCPGGQVVNASSEEGCLVVNGMSNYNRDGENANSALVVSVRPDDFKSGSPLSGIEFQRKYERLAYRLCDGKAPVQLTKDFMNDRISRDLEETTPSFTGRWQFADIRSCIPDFVAETLKEGLESFNHKMKGFAEYGVMTGVETRTSAPVRISRNDRMQSVNVEGLYPLGEGAGYAGGIMSAAVDGIKGALAILKNAEDLQ